MPAATAPGTTTTAIGIATAIACTHRDTGRTTTATTTAIRTTVARSRTYYYPYSFGYGPHGRGYFYFDLHYDSYVFYPPTVARYDNYGTYYGDYGYPTGELKLQVRPRDAQVFINGAYAGTVDEFDGTFQSMRLEGGEYQVEIVLPGYEPLDFDVHITAGEKVTYKGDLLPEQQP